MNKNKLLALQVNGLSEREEKCKFLTASTNFFFFSSFFRHEDFMMEYNGSKNTSSPFKIHNPYARRVIISSDGDESDGSMSHFGKCDAGWTNTSNNITLKQSTFFMYPCKQSELQQQKSHRNAKVKSLNVPTVWKNIRSLHLVWVTFLLQAN